MNRILIDNQMKERSEKELENQKDKDGLNHDNGTQTHSQVEGKSISQSHGTQTHSQVEGKSISHADKAPANETNVDKPKETKGVIPPILKDNIRTLLQLHSERSS